ncbi:MAG: tetratricopeptide repeat protein [Lewinellaceae bacterium]|nr:tetratricopeptide repeat protein [Lewinellaceae bacterium]
MRTTTLLLAALITLVAVTTLSAQDLAEAKRLAEAGQHFEAQKMYNTILLNNPDQLDALIGAGYNLSWAGRHEEARKKFESALKIDPKNADALIGHGYNLAWNKQYAAAKSPFQMLNRYNPGNVEARKGLGYVYLWQGNGQVAIRYFEDLLLENPENVEYHVALAQAFMLEKQIKKARTTLQAALAIEPSHRVANDLFQNTHAVAVPVELDIWTGYSETGDMGTFNLRTVQLTAQVTKKMRMYLKYDNSLSLDLASLVRTNQEAQAFSIGAVIPSGPKLISRVEYGARFLPDNAIQQVFSTEQVYFLSDKISLKGGGFVGLSSKINNEWLAYCSVRVPISTVYAIEPYYFFARVEGAPRSENRFMLNNQFRSKKGYELNIGALYGIAGLPRDAAQDKIYGSYITTILPFSRTVWGQASVRWEKFPTGDLLAFGFGVKLRLER